VAQLARTAEDARAHLQAHVGQLTKDVQAELSGLRAAQRALHSQQTEDRALAGSRDLELRAAQRDIGEVQKTAAQLARTAQDARAHLQAHVGQMTRDVQAEFAGLRAAQRDLHTQQTEDRALACSQVVELRTAQGDLQKQWAQDRELASSQALEFRKQIEPLAARCARMERQVFARPYVNPEFKTARPDPDSPGFDYYGFEQKFRGPSALIKEKLAHYLPYFQGSGRIVDIGCGRGEFLEALRDAGRSGLGVEANARQAAKCRHKGLPVLEADLFDYLEGVPNDSLDGIFCAQVIEHLGMAGIDRFMKLCQHKLVPGGTLIAETVNPHCLAAFQFFYLDPTHVAPLYPEVMQFVAESAGFQTVQICFPAQCADAEHECGEYAVIASKTGQ
jgi:2-polyprenyl-3-methyl-5-hydroxy-6-metoxy-1,4-benzoquinol methylase